MGLAEMGVPDHSHMPRADVLMFEHLVETQLLALLLEPGMPSSVFSNSPVSLSKIDGVMSGWHLWGWGQCFTSGQTSNSQIKRDKFLSSCNKTTSSSLNRFEWVLVAWVFHPQSMRHGVKLPCSSSTAPLLCSNSQLGGLAWKCALNRWTCVVLFFSLLTLHPRVANKIVLSMEV